MDCELIKTFADNLDIPIGIYPLIGGGCIGNIPKIWHFYDDNHNDTASKVEPMYGDFNDNDTHGMTNTFRRGYDGWNIRQPRLQHMSPPSKALMAQAFTMHSGNTFRYKMDGTHAEQVTYGQINPFGGFFDLLGNRYDSDSESKPFYLDARPHYECFDCPEDVLGNGPKMMNHMHGSTALAGACGYFAEVFLEFRGNFLSATS